MVMHSRNNKRADFVDVSDPENLRYLNTIDLSWRESQEPGNNDLYAQAQDEYVFVRRAKLDMTGLLEEGGNAEIVLRFDITGNNRPAGSVGGITDISQYMYPMGNLLITAPYSFSGRDALGVWAHQAEPDTRAPYVSFHRPYDGQTNFPLGAPVSIVINESLSGLTLIDGVSVILRDLDGNHVTSYVSFAHDDILTITPVEYLEPNTTYEVVLPAGGIKDVANNAIEGYSFRFSTGNTVTPVDAPPTFDSITVSDQTPADGQVVTTSLLASHPQGLELEYRFDPGDGSPDSGWVSQSSFQHSYSDVGHYVQSIDVRASNGLTAASTRTIAVLPDFDPVASTRSGPMWLDESARRLWVVNPDNDSIAVIDADSNQRVALYDLSFHAQSDSVDPQAVALDAHGQAWVTARGDDAIYVLNTSTGTPTEILSLPYGAAPSQVAASADGSTVWVTLNAGASGKPKHGRLLRFDAQSRTLTGEIDLGRTPRAIATIGDRVFVSRFISDEDYGEIWEVRDGLNLSLTRTFRLARDRGPDNDNIGRGVPNYIAGLCISPDGQTLYYSANKANTQRGDLYDSPATHDSTVRAMLGKIDLVTNSETAVDALFGESYRVDIDNSDSPTAVLVHPRGDWLFTALQGNDHVATFDRLRLLNAPTSIASKSTTWRIGSGSAPQGLRYDSATESSS